MDHTTLETLERRVAALEKGLADMLKPNQNNGEWKDWRQAISGVQRTELAEEVDAAVREIREAHRRQTSS